MQKRKVVYKVVQKFHKDHQNYIYIYIYIPGKE